MFGYYYFSFVLVTLDYGVVTQARACKQEDEAHTMGKRAHTSGKTKPKKGEGKSTQVGREVHKVQRVAYRGLEPELEFK